MATVVSMINMKGGVGKTTLTFNLAWYCAWEANLRVLAVDLDPQSNLSQYFLGEIKYQNYILDNDNQKTIVDIFERFTPERKFQPEDVIKIHNDEWEDRGLIDLIPCTLELNKTLKNPTSKAERLKKFLDQLDDKYDLIIIDCAPTDSILTTAAYFASDHLIIPVKPEFLAKIGLPLLRKSLIEHYEDYDNNAKISGIIFTGNKKNSSTSQKEVSKDVISFAINYGYYVFKNEFYHSEFYPSSSKDAKPIFMVDRVQTQVKEQLYQVGEEFLEVIGLQ
ncbi:ParA family protein [Anabaena aphanizomenioides LEGE 00250]|uniref:ParA family protein n=1 Tax=Sphaerospermopsis aphanizomenoides LEGE 00250 TaxID=2777972 RepID=A0ABR9VJ60_9CYAN|nr:ParA family protein [Sphaerospermopsis aphanizomenoides]MBE9238536.1 ParA family protein [Sphaerospermopsis aphanizomenoides LEGE 00250]